MTRTILVVLLAALSGCVSQSTLLRNKDGQTVKCAGWGFGLIGAPAELIVHNDCMKKAHAAGYSETPIAATAGSQAPAKN